MRVGVPREIKVHEYRVGLTPGAVREYVAVGHSVVVETGAGAGLGATDDAYRKAGAVIAQTTADYVDPYRLTLNGVYQNYSGGDPKRHDLGVDGAWRDLRAR